jgi:GT2 family glycosyltransferase
MKISILTPSIRPEFLNITQKSLEEQTYTDFEWLVEVGLHQGRFTLPEDMNKMLKRAKGDIIVSLQDCISISPDALEKIASLAFAQTGYTFPVGKSKEGLFGKNVKWDWRKTRPMGDPITGNMFEIDFAAAPKQMFYDIGGFDERFCEGWSFDNVELAWRAVAAGYTFYHSTITEGVAVDHDAITPHPHRSSLPLNDAKARATARNAERGVYKLKYLY